jgi:hypothetical protein
MSALRTWHLDVGVTGQVRTLRRARDGGASGTWSLFFASFGLVSARRTELLTRSSHAIVELREYAARLGVSRSATAGWRGRAGGGAAGARCLWRRGAHAHPLGRLLRAGRGGSASLTPTLRRPIRVSNQDISRFSGILREVQKLMIAKDKILAKDLNRIGTLILHDHGYIMRTGCVIPYRGIGWRKQLSASVYSCRNLSISSPPRARARSTGGPDGVPRARRRPAANDELLSGRSIASRRGNEVANPGETRDRSG